MIDVAITDGVARLTLNAPPLNILTRALLGEMREALLHAAGQPDCRVLLLSATGKHFSAGASIEEHLPPECAAMIDEFTETIAALRDFPAPVIAAVQGRCLGGGFELIQAADIVIAAENASFGQPEIVLGVIAPIACVLLAERIGSTRAAHLLFSGDAMNAADAAAAGLVLRVVSSESLEQEAGALATRIAQHSASALRLTKRALRRSRDGTPAEAIADTAQLYNTDLMQTHDALEGLRAFLEKRRPEWSHR